MTEPEFKKRAKDEFVAMTVSSIPTLKSQKLNNPK